MESAACKLMRIFSLLVLLVIAVAGVNAQNKKVFIPDSVTFSIEKLGSHINSSCATENEKVSVIYTWMTNTIAYDVDNMFAMNRAADGREVAMQALASRKAICQGYAELFSELCRMCGIENYTVAGFTKQNGFADYIPHMWNVAKIEGSYQLYDATWGSGGISNKRFVKRPNSTYFAPTALQFLKTHMPFDPVWQLLAHPLTQDEFLSGKIKENTSSSFFNYQDTIQEFAKKDPIEKNAASLRRTEKNGIKNTITYEWVSYMQREAEYLKAKAKNEEMKALSDKYNKAVKTINGTSNLFNEYVQFKNKQFTPAKTDPEIRKMMDEILAGRKSASDELAALPAPDPSFADNKADLLKNVENLGQRVDEESKFVDKYLATKKINRKSLFYTRVPMNGPINNKK